jgi:hypothetical protein
MEQQTPEAVKADTAKENFEVLRKKLEKLEAANAKAIKDVEEERKYRENLEGKLKSLSGVNEKEEEEDYSYISRKDFKSTLAQEKEDMKKSIREELEKEAFQRRNDMFFQAHPDFNSVVTDENVSKLEKYDPHFAAVLKIAPDKLTQLTSVYGKVKEMQEREQQASTRKSATPHPYIAASPFGVGSVSNAPTISTQERMKDPQSRMEARKLLEQYKSGFN